MLQAARSIGRMLYIQLLSLFSPETRAAKTLIEQGWLGRPYHARSVGFRRRACPFVDGYGSPPFVQKRNSGGGALFDSGVYHIASLLYLLGNPQVLRVSGQIYQETEMDASRRKASGYDVEELGLGFIRMEGGLTLNLIEAWAIHLGSLGGSSILGNKGGLCLDPFGFFQNLGDLVLDTKVDLPAFVQRTHNLRTGSGMGESPQAHWVAALQGRVELLPTAELALNAMLISEAIYLSGQLGRDVTAEEVIQTSVSTAVPV